VAAKARRRNAPVAVACPAGLHGQATNGSGVAARERPVSGCAGAGDRAARLAGRAVGPIQPSIGTRQARAKVFCTDTASGNPATAQLATPSTDDAARSAAALAKVVRTMPATGWVVVAAFGAVYWERIADQDTVIRAELDS
jgi:hypothetical protein